MVLALDCGFNSGVEFGFDWTDTVGFASALGVAFCVGCEFDVGVGFACVFWALVLNMNSVSKLMLLLLMLMLVLMVSLIRVSLGF